MKQIQKAGLWLLLLTFAVQHLSAAVIISPAIEPTASTTSLTTQKFIQMTPAEFQELTGKKMNFAEKMYFKSMQKKMKRDLKKGKEVNLEKYVASAAAFKFNLFGFLLGLFLSLIGIIIVLLFFDDNQAWISAIIGAVIGLVVGLAII